MKLSLYNNYSELNKVDKTTVKIADLEGSLLEATSLVNPVVRIFFKPEDFPGYVVEDNNVFITFNGMKITWDSFMNDYVLTANYAYIPDFNRYYIINDIVSYRTNLWFIHLHVDVLMSYKDQIKKLDAFVARNEFRYNPYLSDDKVSFSNEKTVDYILVNNTSDCKEFNSDIYPDTQTLDETYTYVVSAISVKTILSQFVNDTPQDDILPAVSVTASGNDINTYYAVLTKFNVDTLCSKIFDDDTKRSFIKSIISLPYEPDKILGELNKTFRQIILGHDVIELQPQGSTVPRGNYVPAHWAYDRVKFADFIFLEKAKSFKELNPYSRYLLYCPYCDYVEISPEYLGDRIQAYYSVNFDDGSSVLILYNYTRKCVIDTRTARLGVRVGISTSNLTEIQNQKNALALNTAIGVMGSIITTVGGIASYNPMMVGMGVLSGVSTVSKAVTTNAQLYSTGKVEISSGSTALLLPQQFHLKIERIKSINDNDDYSKLFGKPLYEYVKLGELTGYTVVSDCHVENIASATSSEYNEIKSLLETGIIL